MSNSRAAEIRTAIAGLGALLDEVRTNAAEGIEMDLGGLSETTAALCAAVESLPREEARPLVEQLSTLIAACEAIASTMIARGQSEQSAA